VTHARGEPVRTCVGCGQKAARAVLLRFAESGGRVVMGKAGGRGAWLHPARACLERALRRGAFPRALRAQGVAPDARALAAGLTEIAQRN